MQTQQLTSLLVPGKQSVQSPVERTCIVGVSLGLGESTQQKFRDLRAGDYTRSDAVTRGMRKPIDFFKEEFTGDDAIVVGFLA